MNLTQILKEIYIKGECSCGCGCSIVPTLTESKTLISENLQYHINKGIKLFENEFRIGSKAYMELFTEARALYKEGKLEVGKIDKILLETDLGEFGLYEGENVPLDMPMVEGKDVQLNKPKRGGSKAYYVYVRDPKTKKVKKVSFGSGGLRAKINNKDARNAFAKRHNCDQKKDRTKAGYWSCNLPRYAKALGLGNNMNTYW